MNPAAKRSTHRPTTRIVPPELAVARLSIAGFAALDDSERMRAAALGLQRDLGLRADSLLLAAAPAPTRSTQGGEALVAWCLRRNESDGAMPVTDVFAAMQQPRLHWVDAPGGYLIGPMGAATVEPDAGTRDALPESLLTLLATPGSDALSECVLVQRDRAALDDDRLALWSAASGIRFRDGAWPESQAVALVAPVLAAPRQAPAALDRALRWALAFALVCVALSAWRFASLPPVSRGGSATAAQSAAVAAGPLLGRIQRVVPALFASLQGASYGGGAWVLTFAPGVDAESLRTAVALLETNGFAVQSTSQPAPRLRVALADAGAAR